MTFKRTFVKDVHRYVFCKGFVDQKSLVDLKVKRKCKGESDRFGCVSNQALEKYPIIKKKTPEYLMSFLSI